MVLSLAACGKTAKESPAPAAAPVETTAPVETAAANEEEHAISGVVNKMGDFLTLLVDGEYLIFDFAKDLKVDGISEGDDVTVVYTGALDNEETPPVAIEIAKNET